VTLITILTAIIFNLVLPLMASSFGKLSVVLPAQKPMQFHRRKRANRKSKTKVAKTTRSAKDTDKK